MRAYHEYISEALRKYGDRAFAYDNTLDRIIELDEIRLTAAKFAVEASFHGTWNGLARITGRRRAVVAGEWFLVTTIEPVTPCGLPRLSIYTPGSVYTPGE